MTFKACLHKRLSVIAVIMASASLIACTSSGETGQIETSEKIIFSPPAQWAQNDDLPTKTDWYTDSRFGMFIHWGLYSQAAGEWKGERYYGITEWLMRRAQETTAEYSKLASDFNPVEFDAEEWVAVAKASGMKYIVITSKHHDGFALFDSAVSEFDIIDASPFGRDVLKELADAAAAEGIRLGFYYSQYQDWTDPNAGGNTWEFDEASKDFSVYLENKAKPQVDELLTNYGDVGLIWFDTPGDLSKEDAQALVNWVSDRQPQTLISSRVGHELGDFTTLGDAQLPATPITDKAWEAIFTHNDSWGYSSFDNNFKSTSDLLVKLSTVASKNGNLLLNVGPDGNGRLPEGSAARFQQVGEWLSVNGEAIYGTRGSPIGPVPWGAVTHRPGTLYLHVFSVPDSGEILLPYVTQPVNQVGLLQTGGKVSWRQSGQDVFIQLPENLPDERNTVIRLDYEGLIEDNEWQVPTLLSNEYERTYLSPKWANLEGEATPAQGRYYLYFGDWKYYDWIDGLKSPSDKATWPLRVTDSGQYRITLTYAANEASAGQEGFVEANGQSVAFRVLMTEDGTEAFSNQRPLSTVDHHVGLLNFDEPGTYDLVLRPRGSGENLFVLTEVAIEPVD